MNAYKVNFLYHRTDRTRGVKGDVTILAADSAGARVAFEATHPDGSNFHYAIMEVEALAAGELF